MQLLDLMHTLHTKAAAIFSGWEQEAEAARAAVDSASHGSMTTVEEIDTGTSTLWMTCWCPLLQGKKLHILALFSSTSVHYLFMDSSFFPAFATLGRWRPVVLIPCMCTDDCTVYFMVNTRQRAVARLLDLCDGLLQLLGGRISVRRATKLTLGCILW